MSVYSATPSLEAVKFGKENHLVILPSYDSRGPYMTWVRPIRASACLIGIIFLIAVQGCAHTPPPPPLPPPAPLPESLQRQLGKIGVVARSTAEQQAFNSTGPGRLSYIGKVAVLGASIGLQAGAQAGPFAPLAAPITAGIGLAGGALFGTVAVASDSWQEAEATVRPIVAELNLNQALPQHLIAFAQAHGYAMTHLSTATQEEPQKQSSYAAAHGDGIDTVLEIQDLTVNLIPAEDIPNPYRRLTLAARLRLIQTVDETVLDDRVVTDKFGPVLLLDGWIASQATRLRQEVQQAAERLAEQIITEYFLLYPFPERLTYSGRFWAVQVKGLCPIYPGEFPEHSRHKAVYEKDIQVKYTRGEFQDSLSPPIPGEFLVMAQSRVDSLRPTMSWEPFSGSNVTYDLRIWRAGRLGPDALVYSRTNLDQASHKLETALEPSTLYYWSVRAHFSEQGSERITEWSRRSVRNTPMEKIEPAELAALSEPPVAESFFVFITPPPPSQGAKTPESQSKGFPGETGRCHLQIPSSRSPLFSLFWVSGMRIDLLVHMNWSSHLGILIIGADGPYTSCLPSS